MGSVLRRVALGGALLFALGMALALAAGCRGGSTARKAEQKSYHLRGRIVSTEAATGSITVAHQAIAGLMGAMTMSYGLVEPNTMSELHAGDLITARVVVAEDAAGPLNPRLDQIVVVGQARPDTKPMVAYHVPAPGEVVPDFHLLNQSGKQIHLAQFRGRVLLLTFIYTRCPLAEFCPRMSSNFAEIDRSLKDDASVRGKDASAECELRSEVRYAGCAAELWRGAYGAIYR